LTKQGENMEAISNNMSSFETNLDKTNETFIRELDEVKKAQAIELAKQSESMTTISK